MGTKMTFIKKNFWLILLVLLALFLRTYKLSVYPEAVDEDEMSLGYISYSLLHNGTDEYGNKFPIYFKSVGDYKYGLYSYFAMIPISILGLNPFSTRLPAVLFGVGSVVALYYLALEIFKNKKYALASSFVLAVNPTFIHFSRVAYNNVMGGFFTILSVLFLIKYLKTNNLKKVGWFILFAVLSIFSYQAYRVILPSAVILISFLFLNKNNLKKILVLNVTLILLILASFISPASRARSQNFSILVNNPAMIESFSEDFFGGSKLLTTRIFHNKVIDFGIDFTKRYLGYFDPRFLFLETSNSVERHAIPDMGLAYLIELPLLLFAIYGVIKLKISKLGLIPFILIFVAPLGASMVLEASSTTRAIFLVYGLSLLLGFGIFYLLELKKYTKALVPVLALAYLANFTYFYHNYTVHKIYHHPWNSDVGLKEMSEAVMNKYINEYDKVVVSKGHYIPFLFYSEVDVNEFINKTGMFSKIIFGMPYDCPSIGQKNVLYVCFGYKVPKAGRVVEVFRYRDGQSAIILVDFTKTQVEPLPEKVAWGDEIPNIKLDEKSYWPPNNSR